MNTHIAKCGYRCDLCPAFKPELTDADKQDISRAFQQYFGGHIDPKDVKPCTGCQSSETANDPHCPVFPCVQEKGFQTCAECDDFGCEKLAQRMDAVEEMMQKQTQIPSEDYEKYFKPFLSRKTLMEIRRNLEK